MFVCPARACFEADDSPLEPLTPSLIRKIASFCFIELRHTDALNLIARHLHQRNALFSSDKKNIDDYRTILAAVYANDPLKASF